MYDGSDLLNMIQDKTQELELATRKLFKNKQELAEAERNYKMLVNKKALELRANDMPVTLIGLTIYGYPDIAEARFKRDIAQGRVEANEEYINTTKLILRLIEAQIGREWTK